MKNNKGFTLIELIVVIAIIAVLAVVLAPQYIQYVERGRESNDVQIAQNLMDAASVAAADPSLKNPAASYTVSMTNVGGVTLTETGDTTALTTGNSFYDAFVAVVGTGTQNLQSVNGKNALTITVNTQTGDVSWTDGNTTANEGWDAILD